MHKKRCSKNCFGRCFKRITAIITAAVLAAVPAADVWAADTACVSLFSTTVSVSTEDELIAALADCSTDADNPTQIVLTDSIDSESELTVSEGTYAVLSGASEDCVLRVTGSHTSAQSDDTEAFITVDGELTIGSLTVDGNSLMRIAIINANAVLTLDDGAVITGGRIGKKAQMHGGGIFVKGKLYNPATLIINEGASVTGNEAGGESGGSDFAVYGAGIAVQSQADVILNGGSITNNTDVSTGNMNQSCRGGGVWLGSSRSTLTINSGEISGNYARSGGGGVYMEDGVVTMNGGSISDNSSIYNGGGIFAIGTVTINDGSIEDNLVETPSESELALFISNGVSDSSGLGTGGGIYVGVSSNITDTTVTMNGGCITGNKAVCSLSTTANDVNYAQGGGVFNDGTFILNDGSITGNEATSVNEGTDYNFTGTGGGISTEAGDEYGTTILYGGTVSGNTASNAGDDLFVNEDKYETDRSNVTTYYDTPGEIHISGAVTVGEAYLPGEMYLYVTGSLAGASIGVESETVLSDIVAAEGLDYTLTETDAAAFTALTDGYKVALYEEYNTLVYDETREYISLRDAQIAAVDDQVYTGAKVTPSVTVTLDGETLTEGVDYELSYKNNTDVGTATVIARGIGSYGATVTQTFEIVQDPDLSNYTLVLSETEFVYNGYTQVPEVTVVYTADESVVLEETDNYTVSYPHSPRSADTGYTVTVTGTGSYTGTLTATYDIEPADISDVKVKLSAQTFTGKAIKYAPAYGELTLGDYSLLRGAQEDYTIVAGSYKNNKKAGTASFKIQGSGNFTGTRTVTFKIQKVSIKKAKAKTGSKKYTGKKIKYKPKKGTITYGSYTLKAGRDYKIVKNSYKKNKKVGTATLKIKGKGSFKGTKTVKFKITKK